MEYRKEFPLDRKSKREITVTDKSVIVKQVSGNIDDNRVVRTVFRNKYHSTAVLKISGGRFAQGAGEKQNDWYNVKLCQKILSIDKDASVYIMPVAGRVFFKVVDVDEKFASIYDETGALIAKEKSPIILDVIFSASGACLQKTDPEGNKKIYTLEGYLVG